MSLINLPATVESVLTHLIAKSIPIVKILETLVEEPTVKQTTNALTATLDIPAPAVELLTEEKKEAKSIATRLAVCVLTPAKAMVTALVPKVPTAWTTVFA